MRHREEPCTITADVVAEFLERARCPQMADFVRHLGERCQTANGRERDLRSEINRLVDKLHQYEPPQEKRTCDYRSQWD